MTRGIIHGMAVVIVAVAMMAGPADGVVTSGHDDGQTVHGMADVFRTGHPADGCAEDESWTAVHYMDPRGTEDIHGVTRACIHNDDIGRHIDDVTRSMDEWTRTTDTEDGR